MRFNSCMVVGVYSKNLILMMRENKRGFVEMSINDLNSLVNEETEALAFSDESIFALRVEGDGMIKAGIMPDDLVLVRKQEIIQAGDTIVALVGDKATLRCLRRRGQEYYLDSANSIYQPILVDKDVSIIGKVICVVRQFGSRGKKEPAKVQCTLFD